MKRYHKIFLILLVPVFFLVIGIWTIKDYGFNWDEPYHFMRGQAYLHYFLTGEKNYSSLPKYPRLSDDCPEWSKGYCDISPGGANDTIRLNGIFPSYGELTDRLQSDRSTKRSFFQHDIYTFEEIIKVDDGHPPVGGILASLTNYILYQKLGIVGDMESYHLFEVLASFLLIVGVGYLVYVKFGILPSIVSSFSLSFYPLFFAESHFNIKDPVLTSFYGLIIILFYLGIKQKKVLTILLSGVFLGLATGVKFNTIFLPFILLPWFIYYIAVQYFDLKIKKLIPTIIAILLVPIIAFVVFYFLWPFLWTDTYAHLMKIVGFYKGIGTGTPSEMLPYLIQGWNTYPTIWIIYTTPIPVLFFALLGLIKSVKEVFRKNDFALLVLLWFVVPILRVSWPKSSLYGGIRQIMEYIPALAILTGIGAFWLINYARTFKGNKKIAEIVVVFLILASLVYTFVDIYKIHPNENVYFNQLIGGLSGARDKNIPSWGNTYGNTYMQGVKWLNENAEPNSKVGLAVATMGNLPKLALRADIDFYNGHWSGLNREGEYLIELDFNWPARKWYSFQYMDVFLETVYVAKVDGVPLLKIWKNDLKHTRDGYKNEQIYKVKSITKPLAGLLVDLGKSISLTSFEISHSAYACEQVKSGYVTTSVDGILWERESEPLIAQVPPVVKDFNDNNFIFLFPAKLARYIKIDGIPEDSCLYKYYNIEVKGL